MLRGHPFASDGLLAVALAAFVLSEVFTSGSYLTGSNWVYVPVAVLMTVPLALRRRAPLLVVTLVTATTTGSPSAEAAVDSAP